MGHPDLVTPLDTDSNSMKTSQMCIASDHKGCPLMHWWHSIRPTLSPTAFLQATCIHSCDFPQSSPVFWRTLLPGNMLNLNQSTTLWRYLQHTFLPCKEKMLVRKELHWFLADQNNLLIANPVTVPVGTLVLYWWFLKLLCRLILS